MPDSNIGYTKVNNLMKTLEEQAAKYARFHTIGSVANEIQLHDAFLAGFEYANQPEQHTEEVKHWYAKTKHTEWRKISDDEFELTKHLARFEFEQR